MKFLLPFTVMSGLVILWSIFLHFHSIIKVKLILTASVRAGKNLDQTIWNVFTFLCTNLIMKYCGLGILRDIISLRSLKINTMLVKAILYRMACILKFFWHFGLHSLYDRIECEWAMRIRSQIMKIILQKFRQLQLTFNSIRNQSINAQLCCKLSYVA